MPFIIGLAGFLSVWGNTKDEDKLQQKNLMVRMTEFGAKPVDSRIELTKKDNALSVYIPPHGFDVASSFVLGFATWTFGIFLWTWVVAALVPFPTNVSFLLFYLLFWGVELFLFYICLFGCFGEIYLHIDRQMVSYERLLFGQRIGRQQLLPTREIRYLTLIREHLYQDTDGNTKTRIGELRLEGSHQKISLGTEQQDGLRDVSDSESIEWLAHEIREWLNLPMEIVDSTTNAEFRV